jgi:hypothetical protein
MKFITTCFTFFLLMFINMHSQVSNTEEVIDLFCMSFPEGVYIDNMKEEAIILDGYKIVSNGYGDLFGNGNTDVLSIFEQTDTGERFMVAFESRYDDLLFPHSFEFSKIPCADCGGMMGGFYDITYNEYSFTIPILVGSRSGSETKLTYEYIKETDEVALTVFEYEEFDRITGDIFNKIYKNYLTGEQIIDGEQSTLEFVELEIFTNCMEFDQPSEGKVLTTFGKELVMYMEPNSQSEPIVTINYGEQLILLEPANDQGWAVVEYGHMSGYVQSSFILPVPAPLQDRKGIELYMRNIPEVGPLHEVQDEMGNVIEKSWEYEHGLTYIERFFKMSDDYTVMEQHLRVSNIDLMQGWLLACALINELDRTPPTITNNEIMDDNYYQMISVRKVDDGVEIFFPERAD